MERVKSGLKKSLNHSSKKVGVDMLYLFKGGTWLSIEKVVTLLVSFGVSVAFANLISKELFGNYKYLISLAGILSAISLTGLGTVVVRSVAKGYEGTLFRAVRLYLKWSWGSLVGGLIGGAYYLFNGNLTLGISLVLIALTIPITHAVTLYRPYLNGKKLFHATSIYGMANNILPNIALLTALFFTDNVIVIIGSYFMSNTLVTFLLFRIAIDKHPPNNKVDGYTWKLGKHVSIMNTITAIVNRLDAILLFQFFGGTQLAIYTFAIAMPDSIRGSFKMLTALAVPKFVKRDVTSLKKTVLKRTNQFFIFSTVIAGLYVLAAPHIFALLFPAYTEAVFYSQLYAITIALNSLFSSSFFDAQVAIKERYTLNVVSNGASVIVLIPLLLLYGVIGAIIARILSRAITVLFSIYMVWRYKPREDEVMP